MRLLLVNSPFLIRGGTGKDLLDINSHRFIGSDYACVSDTPSVDWIIYTFPLLKDFRWKMLEILLLSKLGVVVTICPLLKMLSSESDSDGQGLRTNSKLATPALLQHVHKYLTLSFLRRGGYFRETNLST